VQVDPSQCVQLADGLLEASSSHPTKIECLNLLRLLQAPCLLLTLPQDSTNDNVGAVKAIAPYATQLMVLACDGRADRTQTSSGTNRHNGCEGCGTCIGVLPLVRLGCSRLLRHTEVVLQGSTDILK
jgi:hypothetical protein